MAFNHRLFLIYILLIFISMYTINTLSFTIKKLTDLNLSWQNCGPDTDSIQLKSLTIDPDPIRVLGNITISGSVDVKSEIPIDVYASILLQRKVGPFFVKVPCVDNFGSCDYNNVCELWSEFCPKYAAQYGLPCDCPIPANTYSVSNANIFINKKLPSELLGEYRATVNIGSNQNHLGCINIDLTVKN